MNTLDAMGSARAMRYFRTDPVPHELVAKLTWAATRAGSAHNSEPWDIVVVRKPDVRAAIGAAVAEAVRVADPLPEPESETDRRIDAGVRNLIAHMGEAPVLVVICARNCYPHGAPDEKFMWSAIGGAAQNMIVAARDLGLGVTPTMFHLLAEPEIREILRVPDDRTIGFTAVVGWPARPFGPLARRPLDEVVHDDVWS
jgi:nitroreductase